MNRIQLLSLLVAVFTFSPHAETFRTQWSAWGAVDEWQINEDLESVTLISHSLARSDMESISLNPVTNPSDNKTYIVTGLGDGTNCLHWIGNGLIEIPENILRINDNAFLRSFDYIGVPRIDLPKGNKLKYIGNNAIGFSNSLWINSDCDVRNIGAFTPYYVHFENRKAIGEEGGSLFYVTGTNAVIEVDAKVPPTVLGEIYMSDGSTNSNQYEITTLYVPVGCVEAYRNDPKWGLFTNILELAPAGIEDAAEDIAAYSVSAAEGNIIITSSDSSSLATAEIYTPAGLLVKSSSLSASSTAISVSAGLYIVHIGANNTYKVAVH